MLLAIDIGNTSVAAGLFAGERLIQVRRYASDAGRAAAAYRADLRRDFGRAGVSAAALGSVVPALTPKLAAAARALSGRRPLVVDRRLRLGLRFAVDRPAEVGADRILNALAAHRLYGGPAVVLDFGTATTFDCVSEKGYYLGGAILVGPRLAAAALAEKTAKLPQVEFARPRRAVGRNTVECIQAGLYFGFLGMVDRVLAETVKELGGRPKVLVTGGYGDELAPALGRRGLLVPDLTLQGLRLAYETAR